MTLCVWVCVCPLFPVAKSFIENRRGRIGQRKKCILFGLILCVLEAIVAFSSSLSSVLANKVGGKQKSILFVENPAKTNDDDDGSTFVHSSVGRLFATFAPAFACCLFLCLPLLACLSPLSLSLSLSQTRRASEWLETRERLELETTPRRKLQPFLSLALIP